MGNTNKSYFNAKLPANTAIFIYDAICDGMLFMTEAETPISLPSGCYVRSSRGVLYRILNGNTAIDYDTSKKQRKIFFRIKNSSKVSYVMHVDGSVKKTTVKTLPHTYGMITQHIAQMTGSEIPIKLELGTVLQSIDADSHVTLLVPENINKFSFTLVTTLK